MRGLRAADIVGFSQLFWAIASSDDIFQVVKDGGRITDAPAECLVQGCGDGRQHGIVPKGSGFTETWLLVLTVLLVQQEEKQEGDSHHIPQVLESDLPR